MTQSRTRRDFLVSAGAGAGAVVVGGLINGKPASAQTTMPDSSATTGNRERAPSTATDQYSRKSASDLTAEEISRFKTAFQLVIDKGIMSQFATEHYNFLRHWHHGALLNTQNISAVDTPEPSISRFLSWHRAFLMELENSMQEALDEAGDPNYGEVFLPYWDWSHMDDMPAWTQLEQWRPTGVTATAVEGLPKGNPGYGIQGQTYEVELVRWPGTIQLASTLPSAEHVELILREKAYYDFTTYLDYSLMMVVEKSSDKATRLAALIEANGSPSFMAPLVRSLQRGNVSREDRFASSQALMRLNNAIESPEMAEGVSSENLLELLKASLEVFPIAPHGNCHLWAGGQNEEGVRGTVTYFSELTVDPLFWMLHCELDRIFYTWEVNQGGEPELEGRDRLFQPWRYGYYYLLEDLTDHDTLQYNYDHNYAE